jgi:hypothetical protein
MPRKIEDAVYHSKFRRWDVEASVRAKPRHVVGPDDGGLYFRPEAVPFLDHPLVRARGAEVADAILLQRLHVYLDFTAELEQSAVNPVCAAISRRRSGLALPEAMLADAHKIYTDEAWHAQFSDDLQRQIVRRTGVAPVLPEAPAFMSRLAAAEARMPAEAAGLAPLFFAIVSETLISAILFDIPRDSRVRPSVRAMVADHAADERIHHAYFAKLLQYAWHQLGARQRRAVGVQIPEFIRAFLDPDYPALVGILRSVGLEPDDAGQVLSERLDERRVAVDAAASARHTIRHLASVGVFEDPEIAEAFEADGLFERGQAPVSGV